MKNQFFLLTICFALFGLSACDKEDTNGDDLTTDIIGHYTNAGTNTDIVVNKVDDTTVSIALTTGSGSGYLSVAFPDVDMTSATAFTLNTVTGSDCGGTATYSGTGTSSNGNISLFITIVNTGGGCDGTFTRSVSASK